MSVEEESVSETSQPETTQTESETEKEVTKKRAWFSKCKTCIGSTKYAELEQQLQHFIVLKDYKDFTKKEIEYTIAKRLLKDKNWD